MANKNAINVLYLWPQLSYAWSLLDIAFYIVSTFCVFKIFKVCFKCLKNDYKPWLISKGVVIFFKTQVYFYMYKLTNNSVGLTALNLPFSPARRRLHYWCFSLPFYMAPSLRREYMNM